MTQPTSRQRVCFVHGTWQLIMLASALKTEAESGLADLCETVLVLYAPYEPYHDLRAHIREMASFAGDWCRVVSVGAPLRNSRDDNQWPLPVDEWTASLREQAGVENAAAVWLPSVIGFSERLIAAAYPNAELITYEEGLSTYSEQHLSARTWRRVMRLGRDLPALVCRRRLGLHLRSGELSDWRVPRSLFRRVKQVYTLLSSQLDVPEPFARVTRVEVPIRIVRSTLEKVSAGCRRSSEHPLPRAPEGSLLFLAGMSHVDLPLSWDDEISLYRSVVGELIEKGCGICWKEHPRETRPFNEALRKHFSDRVFSVLDAPQEWPAEVLVDKTRFTQCVGTYSSSLYSLPMLFGTRTYTIASRLVSSAEGRMFPPLAMALRDIADYRRVPAVKMVG